MRLYLSNNHWIKHARTRVFTDPYSRIFYAVNKLHKKKLLHYDCTLLTLVVRSPAIMGIDIPAYFMQ